MRLRATVTTTMAAITHGRALPSPFKRVSKACLMISG